MLYDDIISLLNESFRAAHVVDDDPLDRRIIADWIMLQRNVFAKNYMNQNPGMEQNNLQFEILDIETYDPALILGGISVDKKILRTTPCPTLIEGKKGVAVYELSSPDLLSKTIQSVSFDRLRWCGNGKTNKHSLFAAFYDGRWYVKSGSEIEKPISKLQVVGIFSDPTQVSTYNRLVDDYPINDFSISYMMNMVKQQDFSFLSTQKSDNTNDSSGDINQEIKR